MKHFIARFILFFSLSPAYTQNDNCNCLQDFNTLTEKLEANYVAWHLNKSELEAPYNQLKSQYRQRAGNTSMQDCVRLLQSFLDFFKDGHLFAAEFPEYSKEELDVFKKHVKESGSSI